MNTSVSRGFPSASRCTRFLPPKLRPTCFILLLPSTHHSYLPLTPALPYLTSPHLPRRQTQSTPPRCNSPKSKTAGDTVPIPLRTSPSSFSPSFRSLDPRPSAGLTSFFPSPLSALLSPLPYPLPPPTNPRYIGTTQTVKPASAKPSTPASPPSPNIPHLSRPNNWVACTTKGHGRSRGKVGL